MLVTWASDARIEIGDEVGISGGVICARKRISIGSRTLIGANVKIVDTDFHPLSAEARRTNPAEGEVEPVCIEEDCFIGMHSLILKGSHIGKGAVIGAGSVVTGDIPTGAVAAGNPARIIRTL